MDKEVSLKFRFKREKEQVYFVRVTTNQGSAKKSGGSDGQKPNEPDMASMMNMMSTMMNNKEGMDMFKNMMGNMNNQKGGSRQTINKSALKKMATVNKLKSKLAKRNEKE